MNVDKIDVIFNLSPKEYHQQQLDPVWPRLYALATGDVSSERRHVCFHGKNTILTLFERLFIFNSKDEGIIFVYSFFKTMSIMQYSYRIYRLGLTNTATVTRTFGFI